MQCTIAQETGWHWTDRPRARETIRWIGTSQDGITLPFHASAWTQMGESMFLTEYDIFAATSASHVERMLLNVCYGKQIVITLLQEGILEIRKEHGHICFRLETGHYSVIEIEVLCQQSVRLRKVYFAFLGSIPLSRVLGVWLLDGMWIGWLDLLHLYTQHVTTSIYNTIANFDTTNS
jgi:hypothetical protein